MRTPFLNRLLVTLSAFILGATVVHWGMQWRSSLPNTVIAPHKTPDAVTVDLDTNLFGRSSGQNEVLPEAVLSAAPSNLKLIGVITSPRNGMGVAIISIDGKANSFREGEEIAAGTQLQSVRRDSVVLIQNNQPLELALENLNKPPSSPSPQMNMNPNPGSVLPGGRNAKTPAFKLDVQNLGPNQFSFSQAELNKGLQDPKLRNSLGDAIPSPSGGLLLREVTSGSLLDRLGLRTGDILRQANGQPLNNLADIPALYQQFGNGGMVKLELLRGGQPSQIQYTVRP